MNEQKGRKTDNPICNGTGNETCISNRTRNKPQSPTVSCNSNRYRNASTCTGTPYPANSCNVTVTGNTSAPVTVTGKNNPSVPVTGMDPLCDPVTVTGILARLADGIGGVGITQNSMAENLHPALSESSSSSNSVNNCTKM